MAAFTFRRRIIVIWEDLKMKNKLLTLLIAGLILSVATVFIYQRTTAQVLRENKVEDSEALAIVKSQPVSNAFYDNLKSADYYTADSWTLVKAFFNEQTPGKNTVQTGLFEKWYLMKFLKNGNEFQVSIYEYKSPELASEIIHEIFTSQGSVEKAVEYGDETLKGFTEDGKFIGLRFIKNNFAIYVSANSEETAKVLAESALKAIEVK